MAWPWDDAVFNQYLNEHAPDISGGIGHLLSRNIITGGSVEWGENEPARADIDLLDALPAMPSREVAEIFIRVAHGWPTDPFKTEREPATRALASSSIWLHWPEREHGWHWVMAFPHGVLLPAQFSMAAILYDELPGDLRARFEITEDDKPLTIHIERHDSEAVVTTVRQGVEATQRSSRSLQETIRFALDDLDIDYVYN